MRSRGIVLNALKIAGPALLLVSLTKLLADRFSSYRLDRKLRFIGNELRLFDARLSTYRDLKAPSENKWSLGMRL